MRDQPRAGQPPCTGDEIGRVDRLMSAFYGTFPYPWRAQSFDYIEDPDFIARMLGQELGVFDDDVLPSPGASIWVPGCGTNQAVTTALYFPNASVIGSDVAGPALDIARDIARDVGVRNLIIQEESIFSSTYSGDFDYIICTGVLDHTGAPGLALRRLAAALKPTGVLELMVHNRYHRTAVEAFQEAVHLLSRDREKPDFDAALRRAKSLMAAVDPDGWHATMLTRYAGWPEAGWADTFINPVEHSFTVDTLSRLAREAGLRLVGPCTNMYVQTAEAYHWELEMPDAESRQAYDQLADVERWHLTNLLKLENSPRLWFYLQHERSPRPLPGAREVCRDFLARVFCPSEGTRRHFLLTGDGHYRHSPRVSPVAAGRPHQSVAPIYELADGTRTMGEICAELGIPATLGELTRARMNLTSRQFPYLVAC